MNFCPNCGSRLSPLQVGGRPRPTCSDCRYSHMGAWTVGVGGIVVRDDKVLLARRAIRPAVGSWAIPGGYVESDETLETAVAREILEETGVAADVVSLVSARSVVHASHLNTYLVFILDYRDGEAVADGVENDEAGWFSRQELDALSGLTPASKTLLDLCLSGAAGLPRVPYQRPSGEVADCFAVTAGSLATPPPEAG